MAEKIKNHQYGLMKNKKTKEKPRQSHTPEGPAEEFIDEYSSVNNPPPPPSRKR